MTHKARSEAGRDRDYVKEAARALCDLNMYHAVMALLESSLIDSSRQKTDQAIIRLCRIESSQCLRDYDRAYAKATGTPRTKHANQKENPMTDAPRPVEEMEE